MNNFQSTSGQTKPINQALSLIDWTTAQSIPSAQGYNHLPGTSLHPCCGYLSDRISCRYCNLSSNPGKSFMSVVGGQILYRMLYFCSILTRQTNGFGAWHSSRKGWKSDSHGTWGCWKLKTAASWIQMRPSCEVEMVDIWVCLKIGYIPNEIAIKKRDNDHENHCFFLGTQHFQTHPYVDMKHATFKLDDPLAWNSAANWLANCCPDPTTNPRLTRKWTAFLHAVTKLIIQTSTKTIPTIPKWIGKVVIWCDDHSKTDRFQARMTTQNIPKHPPAEAQKCRYRGSKAAGNVRAVECSWSQETKPKKWRGKCHGHVWLPEGASYLDGLFSWFTGLLAGKPC